MRPGFAPDKKRKSRVGCRRKRLTTARKSRKLRVKPVELATWRYADCLRANQQALQGLLQLGNRFLQGHGVGGDEPSDFSELVVRTARSTLHRDEGLLDEITTMEEMAAVEAMVKAATKPGHRPPDNHSPALHLLVREMIKKSKLFGWPLPKAIADDVAKNLQKSPTRKEKK